MIKKNKSSVQFLNIPPDFAGQRLDNFLITKLKGMPKSHIYRLIRKGEIRINKKRIKPEYRLQAEDILRLPPMELALEKKIISPRQNLVDDLINRIVYEDTNFIIINKPSGLPVHGGSNVKLGLVEVLRKTHPEFPQLELVHRLDADTSGCLILAKKRSILRQMHELLREGKVQKTYLTLTKGQWLPSELRVEVSLQKNLMIGGERMVVPHKEGKPSLTIFKPIQSYPGVMLLEVMLLTGRTHQIRVHAQYRGHPIAGDEKYGDRDFNKSMRKLGLKRLFLHAHRVEFTLPENDQKISVSVPLGADLQECLDQLVPQY